MDDIVGNIGDLPRNPDGSVTIPKAGVWEIGRPETLKTKGAVRRQIDENAYRWSAVGNGCHAFFVTPDADLRLTGRPFVDGMTYGLELVDENGKIYARDSRG